MTGAALPVDGGMTDLVDGRRQEDMAMAECTHLDQIADVEPQTPRGAASA